jgi:hypothetical protein
MTTQQLIAALQAAGAVAKQNSVLHQWSAREAIESLNATVAEIDSFHAPLRVEESPAALTATPWRQAIRDPQQRRTAGKEAAQKGAVAGAAVVAIGAVLFVRKTDDEE